MQADDVTIEFDRPVEAGDRQMHFQCGLSSICKYFSKNHNRLNKMRAWIYSSCRLAWPPE